MNIIADAVSIVDISPNIGRIIALDGVAEQMREAGIVPDVIIGDMDEVTNETLEFYRSKKVKVIKVDDQNSTDLDKGIEFCISQSATQANIYNALGGRIDHTLYNLRVLKKYHDRIKLVLVNKEEVAEYLQDQRVEISSAKHTPIAIMSAPKATISSKGLKYDMQGYELEFGGKESSSNAMAQDEAEINIKGGAFLIRSENSKIRYL